MSGDKLKAILRSERGKNAMRRLRIQGRIPAIFYGPRFEPISISVGEKELDRALSNRKGLVNLEIEDTGEYEVIFREIQRDPITEAVYHVDLLGITRGFKITATVPVMIVGIPLGVKTSGGILEVLRRELEIECLPKHLPEKIEVDVSRIDIGESIHIRDIALENISLLHDPRTTIATVVAPTVVKAAVEAIKAVSEGEEEGEVTEGKEEKPS